LIIRSGHNIDPAMIENVMARHPAVALCAAVGQPDTYAGELPVCYVALSGGATATAEDLLAFAQENLDERPAWPKAIHIVPEIPLTAVGKIYKPALRADAAERAVTATLRPLVGARAIPICVDAAGAGGLMVTVDLREHGDLPALAIRDALSNFTFRSDVLEPT
jgi:fatty-acyl-CoA synthase